MSDIFSAFDTGEKKALSSIFDAFDVNEDTSVFAAFDTQASAPAELQEPETQFEDGQFSFVPEQLPVESPQPTLAPGQLESFEDLELTTTTGELPQQEEFSLDAIQEEEFQPVDDDEDPTGSLDIRHPSEFLSDEEKTLQYKRWDYQESAPLRKSLKKDKIGFKEGQARKSVL